MTAYDHWFRMEIEVTGTTNGRASLLRAMESRGWVVTVLEGEDGPRQAGWLVEAGVPGARWRSEEAIRHKVMELTKEAPVGIRFRLQEPITSDAVPLGHYAVRRAVHLPRWCAAVLLWSKLFDTGRQLFLDPGPDIDARAAHESTRLLPGVTAPPSDAVPRLLGPKADVSVFPLRHPVLSRLKRAAAVLLLLALALWSAAVGRHHLTSWSAWTFAAALTGVTGYLLGSMRAEAFRHTSSSTRGKETRGGIVAAGAIALLSAFIGAVVPGRLRLLTLALLAIWFVGNGIRLLLRSSNWRTTAVWLLPALLPLLFVLLPTLGFSLHAYYMDAFGLNQEDVAVSAVWRAVADTKALVFMTGPLIAVAVFGYAWHLHIFRGPGWFPVALAIFSAAFYSAVLLFTQQVGHPAAQAAERAKAEARSGRQPAQYFGIAPHRVCLRAVGEAGWETSQPIDSHPYLQFPSNGDRVVLWDLVTGTPLSVKREQYRISNSTAPIC
ncbi:hypothetical protein [Kitasatospora cineracea]|uniref:hypothetical protein n=1 Tax=Kitasatospora cineracea TaxID=88074 RepID=UPI0036B8E08E